MQEAEQVKYEDWTHIGDHLYQDIEIPSRLGITAEWAAKKELTEIEKRLLDQYGNDSRVQLLIGTAVRAEKKEKDRTAAYHIGCRYAGPVLYSYAAWIVEQAVKKDIKRLYFIARDGYLIKKIVDIILKQKKTGIETYYIYGSRRAWRMASLSENHYNLYQMILWSHFKKITTLDELASVLCVPVEDLYQYLPGVYKKDTGNRAITGQELEYISGKLAENPAFQAYHLRTLEERRRLAQQYLIQELDLSDDQFAFVDVSGGGLTQGCLRQLIKDRYRKPIRTFFFKIDRVNLVEDSITDTFLPSDLDSNLVVEMMCRAPHGQTDRYIEKEGKTVPVIGERESTLQIEHGFYEYEEGIADFTGLMCEVSQQYGVGTVSVKIILRYLEYIAKEPSKEVLEFFASTPSCEAGRGSEAAEYAPRLTPQQIREIYLIRTSEPVELFYKGTDLEYSILRASEEERALIGQYRREHDSALGRAARLEKERMWKEQYKRYGRAAFYPTRLLEEQVILYGAGKFGQDLHNRLLIEQKHHIVLWVDKNAEACRKQGLSDVRDVSEIKTAVYDQLVIAVMDEKLADSIREELETEGICKEKILWMLPPFDFYQMAQWKTEGIG